MPARSSSATARSTWRSQVAYTRCHDSPTVLATAEKSRYRGHRRRVRAAAKPPTCNARRCEAKAQTRIAAGEPAAHRHPPRTGSSTCGCGCEMKRIGEDVAEKLDYVPGVFTVERHVRGKWVCAECERLIQAPVPAHVIDKGIPTAGLLAQVLVAK